MAPPDLFSNILADKLADAAGQPVKKSAGFGTTPFESSPSDVLGWISDTERRYGETTRPGAPIQVSSSEQREAVAQLRALGASLGERFDQMQLKTAYRRLALALHPDRHPGASPQTRAQLNARFAVLCQAYRALRSEPQSLKPTA